MNAGTVINRIIKTAGMTQKKLAEVLGVPDNRYVSARLKQKNLSINLANEMLEPLGYEIVFRPKDPESALPAYVITTDEEVK